MIVYDWVILFKCNLALSEFGLTAGAIVSTWDVPSGTVPCLLTITPWTQELGLFDVAKVLNRKHNICA